jgi:hypothetical protein
MSLVFTALHLPSVRSFRLQSERRRASTATSERLLILTAGTSLGSSYFDGPVEASRFGSFTYTVATIRLQSAVDHIDRPFIVPIIPATAFVCQDW